jgi:hypothetical protein
MGSGSIFLIIGVIIALCVRWYEAAQAKVEAYEGALKQIIENARPQWEAGEARAKEEVKEEILHALSDTLTRSPFDFFSYYYKFFPSIHSHEHGSFNFSCSANTDVKFASGYTLPSDWRLKDGKLVYEKSFKVGLRDFDPSLGKHFKQQFLRSIKELAKGSSIYDVFLDAGLFREHFFRGGRNYWYYKHGPVSWMVRHTTFNKSTFGRMSNNRRSSGVESKPKSFRQLGVSPKRAANEKKKDQKEVSIGTLNSDVDAARKELPTQPFVKRSPASTSATAVKRSRQYNFSSYKNSSTFESGTEVRKLDRASIVLKEKNLSSETSIYVLLTPFQSNCPEGFVDIKVGESTNIENRVRDYISYWQDRFKVVCLIQNETVSKEPALHKSLKKWGVSGEFYQIPVALYQAIVKEGTADGMVKVIMEYE